MAWRRATSRVLLVLFLLAATTAANNGTPKAVDGASRLKNIALTYVESYETVRRFEDYSRENLDLEVDIVADPKYYNRVFDTTAIDVHGAMVATSIEDVNFPHVTFFRVYASFVNPPYPVYVLGVKSNGAIIRLQGLAGTDFNLMVRGVDARPSARLLEIVRLYYRLHTPYRPGPVLDKRTLRHALETLQEVAVDRRRSEEEPETSLFLPEVEPEQHSTVLRLCVFDETSTRLEIHMIRVDCDGPLEVLEKKIVRDFYAASY